MRKQFSSPFYLFPLFLFLFFLNACGNGETEEVKDIVVEPEKMNERVKANINELLLRISDNGKADDSTTIFRLSVVDVYYKQSDYKAVWSSDEHFLPLADSMMLFIQQARLYGLFPNDYHYPALKNIAARFAADTAAVGDRRDAALWSKADVLLTDAFFTIAAHLHTGRLKVDSTYMNPDSVLTDKFYHANLSAVVNGKSLSEVFHSLEPSHEGYSALKKATKRFIDSADFDKKYTYVSYPYKDSMAFIKSLVKRLQEEGMLSWQLDQVDSTQLKEALIKLQKKKELNEKGWGLKIFDAYRPYSVTVKFWELIKDERYVANPSKGSGHNRGLAVDLTIVDLNTGVELDMGTGFDNFTDTAHHSFTQLNSTILQNRKILKDVMLKHGFNLLETEWWHYYWPTNREYEVLDLDLKKLKRLSSN